MGFGVTCVHFPYDDTDSMVDASALTPVANAHPILETMDSHMQLLLPSGDKVFVDGLRVEQGRGKVSMVGLCRLHDTGLETCTGVFALAKAAHLTVINEQASRSDGTDMTLIVQDLADESIEDWMLDTGYRRICSPEALMNAFAGSFGGFVTFRDKVIGKTKS